MTYHAVVLNSLLVLITFVWGAPRLRMLVGVAIASAFRKGLKRSAKLHTSDIRWTVSSYND